MSAGADFPFDSPALAALLRRQGRIVEAEAMEARLAGHARQTPLDADPADRRQRLETLLARIHERRRHGLSD